MLYSLRSRLHNASVSAVLPDPTGLCKWVYGWRLSAYQIVHRYNRMNGKEGKQGQESQWAQGSRKMKDVQLRLRAMKCRGKQVDDEALTPQFRR